MWIFIFMYTDICLAAFIRVNRVVVVGLCRALRVFLQVLCFSSLIKINLSLIYLSFTGPP